MSEEPDYSKLPLEERLVHKVWKARLEAYQEITNQFQKSLNEDDEVFRPFLSNPELFKKITSDSNVVAQEAGISALVSLLEYGGTPVALKLRNHLVAGLCEKGLSSSRAGTKQKSIEALLWLIDLDTAEPVIEQMIPSLSAKLPKLVAGTVKALVEIYTVFGAVTVSPKLVLPSLPKLFSHADRTVRAETSKLTIELYKWMGAAFIEQVLFPDLKPVQQKDLSKAFEKVKDEKPAQQRYLKSQREAMEAAKESTHGYDVAVSADGDTIMGETEGSKPVDPYDLVDPVCVLSKMPTDLATKMSAPKWKDRVETLTDVNKELQVIKVADDDYQELLRILAKSVKDVNIQVVALAANSIECLAKGLRTKFHKYYPIILNPLLERTKEKKPSVLDALNSALDAVFASTSLSDLLEEILAALKHKTPQVRLASSKFLIRCLKETTIAPNKTEVDSIITTAIKLASDTLPDIRTNGFEVIGTLMKITGERELSAFLDKVDDIKQKKIKECFEIAEVKAKASSKPKPKPTSTSQSVSRTSSTLKTSSNSATATKRKSVVPKPSSALSVSQLKKKSLSSASKSTIPSKRSPTSPLKSDPTTSRLGFGNRGLAGRSLQTNAPPVNNNLGLTDAEKSELVELRLQKEKWLKDQEKTQWQIQESKNEASRLVSEISVLTSKLERLNEQHTNDVMTIKSKDTQLQRAQSDIEIFKLKISQLENEIELLQKQSSINNLSLQCSTGAFSYKNVADPTVSDRYSRFSPLHDSNSMKSPTEGIDKKVSSLSIGEQKENSNRSSVLSTSYESWDRATEVTSQLRARIEKMKAKSRNSAFRNNV